MLDALRVIGALILIFFLPGIMLVQALFPRRGELDADFDWLYRSALAIGLSIVITILVNFGLNALGVDPDTGMGYVTAVPITLSLILLSLAFFGIAWFRGGLPFIGKLHPKLIRFPAREPRDEDIPHLVDKHQRFKHQEQVTQKFQLIKQIDKTERLAEAHSGEQKKYYVQRKKKQLAELDELEDKISKIEKGLPETSLDDIEIDYMEVGQDE
ncbi:MAG: DUF1616 domain-containing protein [Thermoplasmata archaeon]|nr:DUF1616 domain-containing protein [Thermoplasmata archaeon]